LERVRETLVSIWQLFALCKQPMRDVANAPMPAEFRLTTHVCDRIGRTLVIAESVDFCKTLTTRLLVRHGVEPGRIPLRFLFAISGGGKSFVLDCIYEELQRTTAPRTVCIPITMNAFSKPFAGEGTVCTISQALGLRAAFAYFGEHRDADLQFNFNALVSILGKWPDLHKRLPELQQVVLAINELEPEGTQIALTVDEMALFDDVGKIIHFKSALQSLGSTADCLGSCQAVAIVASGINLQACLDTGVRLLCMPRAINEWGFLPPADDKESFNSTVEALTGGMLYTYPNMCDPTLEPHVRDAAAIASAYCCGHLRTFADMLWAQKRQQQVNISLPGFDFEAKALRPLLKAAADRWKAMGHYLSLWLPGQSEAMGYFLARAAVGKKIYPRSTLSVRGEAVTFMRWRSACHELSGIGGPPQYEPEIGDAPPSVPRFAIPHIQAWAEGSHLLDSTPPVLRELARIANELVDLSLDAKLYTFEKVAALLIRMRVRHAASSSHSARPSRRRHAAGDFMPQATLAHCARSGALLSPPFPPSPTLLARAPPAALAGGGVCGRGQHALAAGHARVRPLAHC
jgi:hypothetical protein